MIKGSSLIEVLICGFLISFLLIIYSSLLIEYSQKYKNKTIKCRRENYAKEALRFMEYEINNITTKSVEINEELKQIDITKSNNDHYLIFHDKLSNNSNSRILIKYKKNYGVNKITILVDEIYDFHLYRSNNVIYAAIEIQKGESFERCIGIRKLKEVS